MVNLKWNIDGTGFKEPDPKYLDFVEAKRTELLETTTNTQFFVIGGTMAAAWFRGHGNLRTFGSIYKWQAAGTGIFLVASLLA